MTTTLEYFLLKHCACDDGFEFAKDLTLEEFLSTCERGDWILWLFARTNPESLRELTLAKGHCANTVRHIMQDERSLKAVDTAIAFGEGRVTRKELDKAATYARAAADAAAAARAVAYAAYAAACSATSSATSAAACSATSAATSAAVTSAADAASYADASSAAREKNQKLTADICRKYLPIEIWNQEIINEA